MNFDDLTPEQQAKAKACKSVEEILALAKEEGYDLSDAELETVAGGGSWICKEHVCSWYEPCPQDR